MGTRDYSWTRQRGIFPGDALALLEDFLDTEFPNGGLVNLAPPETQMYFDDAVPFQQRFAAFLNEHQDHPHHGTWSYMNSRIAHYPKDFFPNINVLRPDSVSIGPVRRRIPGVGMRQCKYINIAAIPRNPIPRLE
ncbi:hypothetical protein O0I10_006480 [Lichtheimia ornata]|uniref:Uncharacterized protein n=1 Tax=Lichtheimia ornata TaxID=688661 RepID=A0AAD7Y108_9FUNG|nr:uncharacterized protein O0I10_006480 [Lichtheimia ornata]KAJ8657952.1 hypothetical protein O0I10_006480 [Lichtheimia ornata]